MTYEYRVYGSDGRLMYVADNYRTALTFASSNNGRRIDRHGSRLDTTVWRAK